MKFFSIFSITIATLLLGYFVIIGLPNIARIGDKSAEVVSELKHDTQTPKDDLILRDKCNTYVASAIFASGQEADEFLDRCMQGQETSKINVIRNEASAPAASSSETGVTEPRLSADELATKCNEFMTHAKFETQKDADSFLKNCLAGN